MTTETHTRIANVEDSLMSSDQRQACRTYLERYVGTPEVLTLDTLPGTIPAVRDIPEGLVFQSGRTRYCRYDRDMWNIETGRILDRSSFLAKRATRLALAQSVLAALGQDLS